jgi:hypothetical protein
MHGRFTQRERFGIRVFTGGYRSFAYCQQHECPSSAFEYCFADSLISDNGENQHDIDKRLQSEHYPNNGLIAIKFKCFESRQMKYLVVR